MVSLRGPFLGSAEGPPIGLFFAFFAKTGNNGPKAAGLGPEGPQLFCCYTKRTLYTFRTHAYIVCKVSLNARLIPYTLANIVPFTKQLQNRAYTAQSRQADSE